MTSRRRCKPTSKPNIAHWQQGKVILSYINLQVDDVACEINIAVFDGYRPKPKFMINSETSLARLLIELKDCWRTNPRNIGTSIPLVFDGDYPMIWDRCPPNLRPNLRGSLLKSGNTIGEKDMTASLLTIVNETTILTVTCRVGSIRCPGLEETLDHDDVTLAIEE